MQNKNIFFCLFSIITILLFACHNNTHQGSGNLLITVKLPQKNITVQVPIFIEPLWNRVSTTHDIALRNALIEQLDSASFYALALTQLDSLLLNDSLNNMLWFKKGRIYEQLQDTNQAIQAYFFSIRIYPNVNTELYLANLLAERRDSLSLSLTQPILLLQEHPDIVANANFIRGVYYSRIHRYNMALQYFNQAIAENFKLMEAYIEMSEIYSKNKSYAEAIGILSTAIQVNPNYADNYYFMGEIYQQKKDTTQAIAFYKTALSLDTTITKATYNIQALSQR